MTHKQSIWDEKSKRSWLMHGLMYEHAAHTCSTSTATSTTAFGNLSRSTTPCSVVVSCADNSLRDTRCSTKRKAAMRQAGRQADKQAGRRVSGLTCAINNAAWLSAALAGPCATPAAAQAAAVRAMLLECQGEQESERHGWKHDAEL